MDYSAPTIGGHVHALDPDSHPWERQPTEGDIAYRMFVYYRDAEKRVLSMFGSDDAKTKGFSEPSARKCSKEWSWSHRCWAYDRYLGAQETEELVRYRRGMNDRHRRAARLAQGKVASWLIGLDPTTLRPAEAAKLLQIAVDVERKASGADTANDTIRPDTGDTGTAAPTTVADLLGIDPTLEADMAEALHRALTSRG